MGFKKADLAMEECALYIAPSWDKINEMTSSDVKKNIKYCKCQNIFWARYKMYAFWNFTFWKQRPILYLPILNDIVRVIASLVKLKKNFCKISIIIKALNTWEWDVRMLSTMTFIIKKYIFHIFFFLKIYVNLFKRFVLVKVNQSTEKKIVPRQIYIGTVYRHCTCTFQEVKKYFFSYTDLHLLK